MLKTRITELLGIKYPVFQGGMAWIADGNLAAAVSNAGGLGIISAMNADGDYIRSQIRLAKSLTDKPFGVNIMLQSPHADDAAKIVVEEGVKVVTTGAGSPTKYMKDWVAAGIKVIPVVPSVAMAKRAESFGASAVIAEGQESGGHIGEITTMALVPQVVDAVSIPVLAAGGIGDGRGLAACSARKAFKWVQGSCLQPNAVFTKITKRWFSRRRTPPLLRQDEDSAETPAVSSKTNSAEILQHSSIQRKLLPNPLPLSALVRSEKLRLKATRMPDASSRDRLQVCLIKNSPRKKL